ncbi:MAG: adenine deaminase [Bacteroidetes bacterium]|nr:MAG: adenine deaminase [Bacteroidota bacterium]
MESTRIQANIVDLAKNRIFFGEIQIQDGKIATITPLDQKGLSADAPFALPGFVDAHVHIESSLLVPSQFARLAVVHGTVATVSDPHEIANVCGLKGVEYMIAEGKTVPFKFYFGAPSCVPATVFETAGAAVSVDEVQELLARPEVKYLSEMMNFPGVLTGQADVLAKIAAAKALHKPIDGHAPALRGQAAQQYINAGISTDHECFTYDEALDKLERGMKILIREGSAAKNFDALAPLLHQWYGQMMFCSDDKHPDSLLEGHINQLCARAVGLGIDVFKVLQAACVNPVRHYGLEVGMLQMGDAADFVLVDNLTNFKVLQTYINGALVSEKGQSFINTSGAAIINNFNCLPIQAADLQVADTTSSAPFVPVIEALDGQLITNKLMLEPRRSQGFLVSNTDTDILKIVVVNRYHPAPVAKGFIKNFGLKRGALASSVAHDSHNIVAVGVDDDSLAKAINLVIAEHGGLAACTEKVTTNQHQVLGLPVAGLMTNADGYAVAEAYTQLDRFAKHELGSTLQSPFMTLSFMALLVIPHLKLSDKGLFDGDAFAFV